MGLCSRFDHRKELYPQATWESDYPAVEWRTFPETPEPGGQLTVSARLLTGWIKPGTYFFRVTAQGGASFYYRYYSPFMHGTIDFGKTLFIEQSNGDYELVPGIHRTSEVNRWSPPLSPATIAWGVYVWGSRGYPPEPVLVAPTGTEYNSDKGPGLWCGLTPPVDQLTIDIEERIPPNRKTNPPPFARRSIPGQATPTLQPTRAGQYVLPRMPFHRGHRGAVGV